MICISLPEHEWAQLEATLRDTADAKLRHRVQIVLMAHRGRRHSDIAADTGTSQRSVPRWLNADLDRRLDGLRPRKAKGATSKLTADLAPVLKQWVIDGPATHGRDRANGTYAELADHPPKATGARVRKSALQAFGSKHGIRPYRPTDRFLRGDPVKQVRARDEIAELKKGRRPATSCS